MKDNGRKLLWYRSNFPFTLITSFKFFSIVHFLLAFFVSFTLCLCLRFSFHPSPRFIFFPSRFKSFRLLVHLYHFVIYCCSCCMQLIFALHFVIYISLSSLVHGVCFFLLKFFIGHFSFVSESLLNLIEAIKVCLGANSFSSSPQLNIVNLFNGFYNGIKGVLIISGEVFFFLLLCFATKIKQWSRRCRNEFFQVDWVEYYDDATTEQRR